MADLSIDLAGIRSPNPFWLASAPPTNSGYQVMRAFAAGWGGAVWKTLGDPIVNVTSRFAGIGYGTQRMMGMNNIELITDRPLEDNLREIAQCKAAYPDRAIVASLMMEMSRQRWHDLVKSVQAVPIDGFELNFGCPHGMSERGMGSAVGQDPELIELCTRWVVEVSRVPVIVKLTPNITDVRVAARAAARGGAHAISMINTITASSASISKRGIRSRTLTDAARTAATAAPRSSRSRSIWSPTARATRRSTSPLAGLAGLRPGRMPPNSCSWDRARFRCARRSCTTASASSKI